MEAFLYKETITSRGLKYHYFFSPAHSSKPTLLFCHGFPSTSHDWHRIVPFFKDRGYGVLVVDMLGYSGTARPTDPTAYVPSLISKDLVDVLDVEKLDKVIAIGHDWGSKAISRLANYYPERFSAYAFLAVPYVTVTPPTDFQAVLDHMKSLYGSELFGYWRFMSEPDADEIIQSHMDSFVSIIFPHDPTIVKTRFAPTGALKQSLLQNYQTPLAPYFSEEDKRFFVETFRRNGFEAPTGWYKIMTSQLSAEDDEQIPPDRAFPPVNAPLYFGAAKHDCISISAAGDAVFAQKEFKDHSITKKEYDAGHWLILSNADEVARDLEAWIEGIVVPTAVI